MVAALDRNVPALIRMGQVNKFPTNKKPKKKKKSRFKHIWNEYEPNEYFATQIRTRLQKDELELRLSVAKLKHAGGPTSKPFLIYYNFTKNMLNE